MLSFKFNLILFSLDFFNDWNIQICENDSNQNKKSILKTILSVGKLKR